MCYNLAHTFQTFLTPTTYQNQSYDYPLRTCWQQEHKNTDTPIKAKKESKGSDGNAAQCDRNTKQSGFIQCNFREISGSENSFIIWEQYQAQRTYSQSESNIRLKGLIQCNLRTISGSANSFTIWEQFQVQRTHSMQSQKNIRLREIIYNLRAISRTGKSFIVIWDEYQAQRNHSVQSESINTQKELIQANVRETSCKENSLSTIRHKDVAEWHNPAA
jgi:hypothetical protein